MIVARRQLQKRTIVEAFFRTENLHSCRCFFECFCIAHTHHLPAWAARVCVHRRTAGRGGVRMCVVCVRCCTHTHACNHQHISQGREVGGGGYIVHRTILYAPSKKIKLERKRILMEMMQCRPKISENEVSNLQVSKKITDSCRRHALIQPASWLTGWLAGSLHSK